MTAARVYVAAHGTAYEDVQLAANLTVTRVYQAAVATMLERSPTFRRQHARIAQAANLTIEVRSEPRAARATSAWTSIVFDPETRQRHAIVHVVPGTSAVELIAHEIEHVIEQLDGVDLRHKASLRATGVRICACGDGEMFETARAIAVGRQVAREVLDGGRGE